MVASIAERIVDLVKEINHKESLVGALDLLTRKSLGLFNCAAAGIWLWKEGKFCLLSMNGEYPEYIDFLKSYEFPKDFGISPASINSNLEECIKKEIVIHDFHNNQGNNIFISDEQRYTRFKEKIVSFGVKNQCCVPLLHFGQMLGVLTLFTKKPLNYEDENIRWIRRIMPLVAYYVHEHQMRLAAFDREQALTLLLRGTEILVQADSESQLLSEAGEMAMEILYLEAGFFLIQEDGIWKICAPFGRLRQAEAQWWNWIDKFIDNKSPNYLPHSQTTFCSLQNEAERTESAWGNVLIQPLQTHNGIAGELWLFDLEDKLNDLHREILGAFARQIGVSLETIRQRRELEKLAMTDRLTGILNRQGFEQRLKEEIAGTLRRKSSFLYLILDLDSFKILNDTQGHPAGDYALKFIASKLKNCVREHDIVARTGGDEFTVILSDIKKGVEAKKVLTRLQTSLGLEKFGLGVSIGVAEFPLEAKDYEGLYKLADNRLYIGKNSGKGSVIFG